MAKVGKYWMGTSVGVAALVVGCELAGGAGTNLTSTALSEPQALDGAQFVYTPASGPHDGSRGQLTDGASLNLPYIGPAGTATTPQTGRPAVLLQAGRTKIPGEVLGELEVFVLSLSDSSVFKFRVDKDGAFVDNVVLPLPESGDGLYRMEMRDVLIGPALVKYMTLDVTVTRAAGQLVTTYPTSFEAKIPNGFGFSGPASLTMKSHPAWRNVPNLAGRLSVFGSHPTDPVYAKTQAATASADGLSTEIVFEILPSDLNQAAAPGSNSVGPANYTVSQLMLLTTRISTE